MGVWSAALGQGVEVEEGEGVEGQSVMPNREGIKNRRQRHRVKNKKLNQEGTKQQAWEKGRELNSDLDSKKNKKTLFITVFNVYGHSA